MGHTSNDLLHLEHKASSSSSLGSLFLFCHIFFFVFSFLFFGCYWWHLYGNYLFLRVYAAESTLLVCKNGSESKLQKPNHPKGKPITTPLPSSQGNFVLSLPPCLPPSLSLSLLFFNSCEFFLGYFCICFLFCFLFV